MGWMDFVQDLQLGDDVGVCISGQFGNKPPRIVAGTVTKVTKTQVTVRTAGYGKRRYVRKSGNEVGAYGLNGRTLCEWNDKTRAQIEQYKIWDKATGERMEIIRMLEGHSWLSDLGDDGPQRLERALAALKGDTTSEMKMEIAMETLKNIESAPNHRSIGECKTIAHGAIARIESVPDLAQEPTKELRADRAPAAVVRTVEESTHGGRG